MVGLVGVLNIYRIKYIYRPTLKTELIMFATPIY